MIIHLRFFLPALIVVTIGLFITPLAQAQEIWLAPPYAGTDRDEMFNLDAPWKSAASHVKVFKFYANHDFNLESQEWVDKTVADIKRRGIAIALEVGVINVGAKPRPACGGWGYVEGYGPIAMHEAIAKKIKKAGGVVTYIVMDEPLFYGHYFQGYPGGQPGCQTSISDVVKLIAPSLAVYTREFPGALIGDVEPSLDLPKHANWQGDLTKWTVEFQAAMHQPLAFLHLDVAWAQPEAYQNLQVVYHFAEKLQGMQLLRNIGIIYNGGPNDDSDAAWMKSARNSVIVSEKNYNLYPSQVIIQSWNKFPTHVLPEYSSDALTSLVNFYVDSRK